MSPKSPLAELWSIAWPTVLTMTSFTVMQFVDSLMVGQVGPLEVAAQGNGGIWAFTPIAVGMGFLTVVNTYVAQNLGAGTPGNAPRYAWAAIWMSLVMWLLIMLPMAVALPWMFTLQGHSEQLVQLEGEYGRILLIGSLLTLTGRSMHHYFFGLHRPKVITVSAILGNTVNIVANFIFIFGAAGLTVTNADGGTVFSIPGIPGTPELGLNGAAIGTVIGTTVELVIPLFVFLGPKMHRELRTRDAWKPQARPIKDLIRIGWPAASQYGNELICWSLFMSLLVGRFGDNHMTAGWIALKYMHLSFMPTVGLSVAVTSLVGKYIGAGQPDIAVKRARLGVSMAVVYMTGCALAFLIFRYQLVSPFVRGDVSAEEAERIIRIGGQLMICAAFFQTVDALGIVYTGALRGAGDTIWPGVATFIYSWVFIIAGGLFMVHYFPRLESIGPWIGASAYIILYGISMVWRFESGNWRKIRLLEEPKHEAAQVAPLSPGPPAGGADGSVRDIAEEIGEQITDS